MLPLKFSCIFQEDYEYEDEETENDSEEDPKVIKELLDLIKKAGRYLNERTTESVLLIKHLILTGLK